MVTIVKFKRARTTYVVPLTLTVKKNLTREYFVGNLVQAINASGGLRLVDDDPVEDLPIEDGGLEVSASDIELAFPKAKDSPYNNQWVPIHGDDSIEKVVLNDYDLIAFKFADDDDFRIEQLEYVEE